MHRETATRDKEQFRKRGLGRLCEKVTFGKEKNRPWYWQVGLTCTAEPQDSPTEHKNFIETSLRRELFWESWWEGTIARPFFSHIWTETEIWALFMTTKKMAKHPWIPADRNAHGLFASDILLSVKIYQAAQQYHIWHPPVPGGGKANAEVLRWNELMVF